MTKFVSFLAMLALLTACSAETTTQAIGGGSASTTNQENLKGVISGGGGKGVRCQQNGQTTVEVLDLYEAKSIYRLDLNHSPQNQEEAMDLVANLLSDYFYSPESPEKNQHIGHYRRLIEETWEQSLRFLSPGRTLRLTEDSLEPLMEKNCEMVQIAIYYDESVILVDESLWNQMSWLNRAALIAHEFIYFFDRQSGAENSVTTRKLVGHLFSQQKLKPLFEDIVAREDDFLTCRAYSADGQVRNYFYGYSDPEQEEGQEGPKLHLVFKEINGQTPLFRTSAVVQGIDPHQLFDMPSQMTERGSIIGDAEPDSHFNDRSFVYEEASHRPKYHLDIKNGANGYRLHLYDLNGRLIEEPAGLVCAPSSAPQD